MSNEAVQILDEVEKIRDHTRASLEWGWLAFFVFGAATLLSAAFTRIDDGDTLGLYWLVAGPVACLLLLAAVRHVEVETGVFDRNERAYVVVIGGMVALAIAAGYGLNGLSSDVGPLFPIGAGLLVIAAIDRSRFVAVVGGLILALGALLAIAGPSHADTWAALGEGAILVGAGLLARERA